LNIKCKSVFILALSTGILSCNSGTPQNQKATVPRDSLTTNSATKLDTTPRVTGIGGIFFLYEEPDELMNWYGENLGLAITPFGSPFEFRNATHPEENNYLIWSPMQDSSTYFYPSSREFMINYRVQSIEKLVDNLAQKGVQIVDSIETYSYGKFVHILDLEGNKIELWEPIDSALTRMGAETTY